MINFNKEKLCECGCGLPAPIATRNWHYRGVKKGQPLRFICGHHRRGLQQSVEEKTKRMKTWGVNDFAISPYLPNNKIIRYHADQKRWYCSVGKSGPKFNSKKPHARAVYEHYYGKVPDGLVVHHKSGKATNIEDDAPDNLMLLSREWNLHYMPRLARGFMVNESDVTEAYLKVFGQVSEDNLFTEVCRELLDKVDKRLYDQRA